MFRGKLYLFHNMFELGKYIQVWISVIYLCVEKYITYEFTMVWCIYGYVRNENLAIFQSEFHILEIKYEIHVSLKIHRRIIKWMLG